MMPVARRSRFILLAACALLLGCLRATPARAQDDGLLPVTQAYRLHADAGTPGVLKLHWTIAPDYYLYRGRMKLTGGNGVTLGQAKFPAGEKHHDPYLGDVETYHHGIDASVPYTVAPGTSRLTLSVQYQGCHEVDPKICYPPHTQPLDLPLPAGTAPATGTSLGAALAQLGSHTGAVPGVQTAPLAAGQAFGFEALALDPHHLLLRWRMPPGYYLYRDQTRLALRDADGLSLGTPAWPPGTLHRDATYGESTVYFNQVELPVPLLGKVAGHRQVQLEARFQGCQDGGVCYPPMTRTVAIDLGAARPAAASSTMPATPPAAMPPPDQAPRAGLLAALLLAFGGGLILNLMPCVLPVLSIKAVGLLESGVDRASARRHAWYYTAGVLVTFAALGLGILALRSAGHALGWGTQLQQPLVVGVLALVMLAVGLSMSGVVQFGATLGNTGQALASRSGPAGDFFTGVLAVVVASPCTAPFMGTALAYAFAAPMLSALLVFLALGLGLALPFLVIGLVPGAGRWLPRPGRWMETLKQVLAFPMYLTAAWLAWVLANQRGADAVGLLLVAGVLLAMTLWWFERSRHRGLPSRILVAVLAVLVVLPLAALSRIPPPARNHGEVAGVVAYTPARLAELRRAGTPVFVDMTADWCVTCKANEHAVLDTDAFRALLARTGTVYMKGDWTDVNPTIAAFLDEYHSPGVPLYVVFPAGGGAGRKLPTVLTRSIVTRALAAAGP